MSKEESDRLDAQSLFAQGRYAEALEVVLQLESERELDAEELYAKGGALLYGAAAAKAAVAVFDQARQLGKSGYWIDFHQACAYANGGEANEAMRLFVACAAKDPRPAVLKAIENLSPKINNDLTDTAQVALLNVLGLLRAEERFQDDANYKADISFLNEKGLFVVGSARSGTTVTLEHLNKARSVLLLSEMEFAVLQRYPDYFKVYGGSEPVGNFNAKQASLGSGPKSKGFHIPVALAENYRERSFWSSLGKGYSYVGEKVALLQEQKCGRYLLDDTIGWHMNTVPNARYLLCMRDPAQIARSYVIKFGRGGARLMMYLILVIEGQMRMWANLPNARVLPHDRWTLAGQQSLASWLDIELRPDPEIDPATRGHDTPVPESLRPFERALTALSSGYVEAMAQLSPNDNEFPFAFNQDVHDRFLRTASEARRLVAAADCAYFLETAFQA